MGNETAKLMGSWWAGEGGHVDAYGRGRVVVRGGGVHNGNRYRGRVVVRGHGYGYRGGYRGGGYRRYGPIVPPICNAYGGCGCGYVGCHCGRVGLPMSSVTRRLQL